MASYDPDFQAVAAEKSPPGGVAEPRRRGCLFYGCVVAVVGAVLMASALALGMLVLYRTALRYRDLYTATAPVELPRLTMTEEQRRQTLERVEAFRDAVADGEDVEPLTLTVDELNALVETVDRFRDRVRLLSLDNDRIKVQISFPLSELKDVSLTRGRYLNGEVDLRLAFHGGALSLEFESILVDGKPLPETIRSVLSQSDVVLDDDRDDSNDTEEERRTKQFFRRLDSIEIVDGVMIITPKIVAAGPSIDPGLGSEIDDRPALDVEARSDFPTDPFAPSEPASAPSP